LRNQAIGLPGTSLRERLARAGVAPIVALPDLDVAVPLAETPIQWLDRVLA